MYIIGLTGSIASGKSTIASMLKKASIPIIDADELTHLITKPNSPALEEIKNKLGHQFFFPDGSLNRNDLGKHIFSNPKDRKILEKILHPKIESEFRLRCKKLKKLGYLFIIFTAPLLFETNFHHNLFKTILVVADKKILIKRIRKRDGLDYEEALMRLKAQMPDSEKMDLADEIITNMGSLKDLEVQLKQAWLRITGNNLIT